MYALRFPKWLPALLLILALAVAFATATALAQDSEPAQGAPETATADTSAVDAAPVAAAEGAVSMGVFTANNLWMMLCTGLVFIMHLGFATLESGLTQQKNTVNILFKNTFIVCFGILSYAYIGFNLMYPGDFNGFLGFAGFGLGTDDAGITQSYNVGYTYWTDFLFQAMFAATAATIISGAVAERIKLGSFMIFTVFYVSLIYPWVGSWKWGGGWLDAMGFTISPALRWYTASAAGGPSSAPSCWAPGAANTWVTEFAPCPVTTCRSPL